MYFLDTLFKDLQTIMKSVVIKFEKYAKENETVDSLRESDRYISARNAEDTFHTYQTFDVPAITNAGVLDPVLAKTYAKDKYLIPDGLRETVVEEQRKLIINSYEEKNNYYRTLQGLPDNEDDKFIFLDKSVYEEFKLDPKLAIHQLDDEAILKIEKRGILDGIKSLYPNKKYLNFLGTNRVDLVRARTAKNFAILALPRGISESFYDEFSNTYEQCREYFMSVIHIKDFSKRYDLYDNFIGLMIMVMTIQRVMTNTFKYGIDRDFYDLGSIQMMFESYNVPFIPELPMDYQRMLVRNLNSLLHYKSTDKVLYDICSILGFERIQIFKYFLIKEHKLDDQEHPIFAYKEVDNGDGTKSLVEDHKKMYDLYFQTVELRERNIALALADSTNRLDYDQVVTEDPFWWGEDSDLQELLYTSEYNYVETKFLNMNIMYKLTEMLFEVMYVFRILLDKKDEIGEVTIQLPKLFENRNIPIFNVVIFLCALIARKNKMVGNIISTPSKTLSILGFNFEADFTLIKNEIQKNPNLDKRMLNWIMDLKINEPGDINKLYTNIKQLNDFIVQRLGDTQNIDEYRAYKKLYEALMITQDTQELFKMSNGEVAETFIEYLHDVDPALAAFVETAEEDKLTEYIDHILYKINGLITDLQYLYIVNDSNNVLLNAVIILIRFFKSYTTDLSSFNILYLMNSRYYNMIKMIHEVKSMEKTLGLNDNTVNFIYRSIGRLATTFTQKEKIALEKIGGKNIKASMRYKDKTMARPVLRDRIKSISRQ